jgi:glutamate dehydrogenase
VNIKILLDLLVRRGIIPSRADRNRVLADMTDEVSALVLADNARQALALTLDGLRSASRYEEFVGLVEDLVSSGVMTRSDDAVPSKDALLAGPARDRGLPRPLLCVMLGHVKNRAFARLLASTLPDSEVAEPFLPAYFPTPMREKYAEHLGLHPLRREIIATAVVNHVVNEGGVSLLHRLMAASSREIGDVVHAYLVVERAAQADGLRRRIEGAGLSVTQRHRRLLDVSDVLYEATRSTLRGESVDLEKSMDGVREGLGPAR